MGLSDITREAVLAAIREHDRDGEAVFLKRHGFGRARSYWLEHEHQLYSSKAIVGVAHKYLGRDHGPLRATEFAGGKATVEVVLTALGFRVRVDSGGEQTSEGLVEGEIYTRLRLTAEFGVTDATLGNGIFQPKGSASVWLFITEKKPRDRPQYVDRLDGNTLYMQGQKLGRTDKKIVDHVALGLELLVFHRKSVREYPGAGFRYLGTFQYQSHRGSKPTNFVLVRSLEFEEAGSDYPDVPPFDPDNVQDTRNRIERSIAERRGQKKFRNALLAAYGDRCAISGCDAADALEAAHIYPYRSELTNHIANGLLLRADLHTLFDLRLISVRPRSKKVVVAKKLAGTEYGKLAGQPLRMPFSKSAEPSSEALKMHFDKREV